LTLSSPFLTQRAKPDLFKAYSKRENTTKKDKTKRLSKSFYRFSRRLSDDYSQ
jgi:hypothetical protein